MTNFDEKELDRLLGLADDHIDLDHCREVDERYRRALACKAVDRPPLVVEAPFVSTISLPAPWNRFRRYGYRETFESPVAMLQNMFLDRVVPGLLLNDDSPLAIRNNHGTIQIAGILGGRWKLHADDYPWVEHFGAMSALERVAACDELDLTAGVLLRSLETLKFYHAKLDRHPTCKRAIQVSLPDLEGPMSAAEQLWGSDIYYAFSDQPKLLTQLLARIVETMLVVSERFREYAVDRLDPVANTQHGYVIPGRLLIRDDSAIMLSPDTYAEFVRPHNARLLREIGTGSIHFCGDGEHLVEKMLGIPQLRGLDPGEPNLMDVKRFYGLCWERGVAVTHLQPSRDDLVSGKARADFPTGCVFVYETNDLADAEEVVREYHSHSG